MHRRVEPCVGYELTYGALPRRMSCRRLVLGMLRISLLGVLRLEVDGVEVMAPSSRRSRLLARLAVERRPHARDALAAWLWPGVPDANARASLRNALAQLRRGLGPDAGRFLQATREQIALAGPQDVWTDVEECQRLLREGQLPAALDLARDELLTGLEDDWVYERRDELRQRLYQALAAAAGEAEGRDDLRTALALTRRQVALDPLVEDAQRELIRRLAHAGDRAAALAAYDRLSQRLRGQLDTIPSARTRELAASVRAGTGPSERGDRTSEIGTDDAAASLTALRAQAP
jgi:DNA-binding SARP family transcriptional activator